MTETEQREYVRELGRLSERDLQASWQGEAEEVQRLIDAGGDMGLVGAETIGPVIDKHQWKRDVIQALLEERHRIAQSAARVNAILPKEAATWLPMGDVLDAFHRAETGDAELLAKLYADRIVFDHSERAWYLWSGQHWESDGKNAVGRLVADDVAAQYLLAAAEKKREGGEVADKVSKDLQARAGALRYRNRISNVLALAANQPGLALTGREWDGDPMLLGVKNGVLNLRYADFEFRAGVPRDYIRTVAPIAWQDLHAPAPRFDQFLQEIFAGDTKLIAFMRRWFGYCLTGAVYEDSFVVLYGESGRNGKRILGETILHVMGTYAMVGDDDLLLDTRDRAAGSPKQFLVDIGGKRMVVLSETKEGSRFHLSRVKQLSGSDTIAARGTFGKRGQQLTPTWKIALSTNRMPHADSDDSAFFERIFVVPFTQRFVECPDPTDPNEHRRDPKLEKTLRVEASGILAWLVRGCLEWQQQGLNPPPAVRLATAGYREREDTLGQYIAERTIQRPDIKTKANELYADYSNWSKDNGLTPMSGTTFGTHMGKRFEKKKEGTMFYLGIGLLK